MTKFNPDCDLISDLIAPIANPSDEQIKVGLLALDAYYAGTKDADIEGSCAQVYRAMKALEIPLAWEIEIESLRAQLKTARNTALINLRAFQGRKDKG